MENIIGLHSLNEFQNKMQGAIVYTVGRSQRPIAGRELSGDALTDFLSEPRTSAQNAEYYLVFPAGGQTLRAQGSFNITVPGDTTRHHFDRFPLEGTQAVAFRVTEDFVNQVSSLKDTGITMATVADTESLKKDVLQREARVLQGGAVAR